LCLTVNRVEPAASGKLIIFLRQEDYGFIVYRLMGREQNGYA